LKDPLIKYGHLLSQFQPKERMEFTRGDYTVKTVDKDAELLEVLKLRYEIFHGEFIQNNRKFTNTGLDIDRYDVLGDHLIIKHNKLDKIVGCYRLICSEYSTLFYSAAEFHLQNLLNLPGTKLELSRACVHKDFRNGLVISLLWRGLAQYIQQCQAKYLFGCASITTMNKWRVALTYNFLLLSKLINNDIDVRPTREYEIKNFKKYVSFVQETSTPEREVNRMDSAKASLPALFHAYIKVGANILGTPAIDKAFKCTDFLTVLETSRLTAEAQKKYMS
jgi:putative hemolysin